MDTVRHILSQHISNPVSYVRPGNGPSLSHKDWVNEYNPLPDLQLHSYTYESVNRHLGFDHAADSTEPERLARNVYPLNSFKIYIQTEADVFRDFVQNISIPLCLAWNDDSFREKSQKGGVGPIQHNKTVDEIFTFVVPSMGNGSDHCTVIGEMKQWGVIKANEWYNLRPRSATTKRLGQEIRGYATLYNCPQVFVYDGCWLLMIQFHAETPEEISSPNCEIDVWCLERSPEVEAELSCPVRYGLYRLIWRGWMRLLAKKGEANVLISGYRREFEGWSGRPFWRNVETGESSYSHPDNYYRRFDNEAQRWYWMHHQDGYNVAWDTIAG